jgi:hypothetical protein
MPPQGYKFLCIAAGMTPMNADNNHLRLFAWFFEFYNTGSIRVCE